MCGIAGVYDFEQSNPVDPAVIRRMCDAQVHRGPDADGFHVSGPVGLGIRRLRVIDLETGDQPLSNEDGSIRLVFNGEIYNFQELRAELEKDHRFTTKTDTEVIVHLYERDGEECVRRLRGMFAFALWDERSRKLFIARDRLGKKPLYYTVSGGRLTFASELRALMHGLPRIPGIDPVALDQYLTCQYIPSPRTIYPDVRSLPPGHVLTCSRDGVGIRRYWQIDFKHKTELSFSDAQRRLEELLLEATRLRMVSDVPLGAFLSGGIDSSIVVSLMSRLSDRPVSTFTVGFEDDDFSELPYARMVARRYGTDHHEIVLKPHFIDLLPHIVRHYGQPFADTSALPSFLISRETREHVTVALNGDGGDEAFGGYLRYKAMRASLYGEYLFRLIGRRTLRAVASRLPHVETTAGAGPFKHLHRFLYGLAEPVPVRSAYWSSFFSPEDKDGLYTDSFRSHLAGDGFEYLVKAFADSAAETAMDRAFAADIGSYLPECLLVKMDIASMAASLESRSPFLDHAVMEFAASLPDTWKVRGLSAKYILKRAFAHALPPEVVRRKKTGFGIPVGKWFQGEWKDYFHGTVLSRRALDRGYFEPGAIRRIFNEHVSAKIDHGYQMWALLVLELWHREFIDRSNDLSS